MTGCIFCKIINGDLPTEKIYEDKDVLAFLTIGPNTKGHTIVVPKKHSKDLTEADDEDLHKVIEAIKMIAPKIVKAMGADGFNLGANNGSVAGQVIFHTHFHIIPRFSDDGLRHWHSFDYKEGEAKKIGEKIRKEIISLKINGK